MEILNMLVRYTGEPTFWEWLNAATEGLVNGYGFYCIYDDFIAFIHWKDLALGLVSALAMIFLVRSQRRRKRITRLEEEKKDLAGTLQRLGAELRSRQGEILQLKIHLASRKDRDQDKTEWDALFHGARRENKTFRPSRPVHAGDDERIQELREALRSGKEIRIEYRDEQGCRSQRHITPLEIWRHGGHVYVRAWCYLREDERSFRVDRIEGIGSA